MDNYRNMISGEVRALNAQQARERDKNVWVLVTGLPKQHKKTTPKSSDSE